MAKFFKLIDWNKPGKGVTKEQAQEEAKKKYSFGNFFRLFGRRFAFLAVLNMVFVFSNLFIFAGLLALTGNFDIPQLAPAATTYQSLNAISQYGFSPLTAGLWGVSGTLQSVGYPGLVTYILYGVAALTILTFGISNMGLSFVLRNLARGESPDLIEYFRAIKKNFWQGIVFGILDLLFLVVIVYSASFYSANAVGGFLFLLLYYLALFIALLYAMMRFYFYPLIVTFKLSLWKVIKNSYILAVAGIKRNILALVGTALLFALNYVLFLVYAPIGALLPFIITPVFSSFMAAYAAYPTIKRLMIDPYYDSEQPSGDAQEKAPDEDEEPVFVDRG